MSISHFNLVQRQGNIHSLLIISKSFRTYSKVKYGSLFSDCLFPGGESYCQYFKDQEKKHPFSEEVLKYRLINRNSFIVYSVGPDEVDDNLEVLEDAEINLNFKELNNGDSAKGDILIYYVKEQ
jgi:hypothetical protein